MFFMYVNPQQQNLLQISSNVTLGVLTETVLTGAGEQRDIFSAVARDCWRFYAGV